MAGVRHAQVGSLPGTDFDAAARFALAETPDPSHLPELPARGAPAQLVGRATALAPGLAFDLQPAGWRLTGGALGVGDSADARRARALLRQWRAAGPMLDYLARFPDEYALIDPR